MRPVVTGWFAEFASLDRAPNDALTGYPRGPLRFAGSTYDPLSHYRAASVMDFFAREGLDATFLRKNSQRQLGLLRERFLALDLAPELLALAAPGQVSELGGFLALRSARALELCQALRVRGVATDARGDILRLGPAPYLSDAQLHGAMDALGDSDCALS